MDAGVYGYPNLNRSSYGGAARRRGPAPPIYPGTPPYKKTTGTPGGPMGPRGPMRPRGDDRYRDRRFPGPLGPPIQEPPQPVQEPPMPAPMPPAEPPSVQPINPRPSDPLPPPNQPPGGVISGPGGWVDAGYGIGPLNANGQQWQPAGYVPFNFGG